MTAHRTRLPNRRHAIRETLIFDGQLIEATAGVDPETFAMRELFLTAAKEGTLLNNTLADVATVISVALQHGIPVDALRVSLSTVTARSLEPREMDPDAGPRDRQPASPIGVALAFLARIERDLREGRDPTEETPRGDR